MKGGLWRFYADLRNIKASALSLVAVEHAGGIRPFVLLSDINQVLASGAGNALEIREAVRFLTGEYSHPRLYRLIFALCVDMLMLTG